MRHDQQHNLEQIFQKSSIFNHFQFFKQEIHKCFQVSDFLERALIEKKLSPMKSSLHFSIGIILSLKAPNVKESLHAVMLSSPNKEIQNFQSFIYKTKVYAWNSSCYVVSINRFTKNAQKITFLPNRKNNDLDSNLQVKVYFEI